MTRNLRACRKTRSDWLSVTNLQSTTNTSPLPPRMPGWIRRSTMPSFRITATRACMAAWGRKTFMPQGAEEEPEDTRPHGQHRAGGQSVPSHAGGREAEAGKGKWQTARQCRRITKWARKWPDHQGAGRHHAREFANTEQSVKQIESAKKKLEKEKVMGMVNRRNLRAALRKAGLHPSRSGCRNTRAPGFAEEYRRQVTVITG